jgi:hypothetical protein
MLAFVHIPKTAGTTLHKIISHQYSNRKIVIRHDADGPPTDELIDQLTQPAADAPEVVMGHMSVGLHHSVPGLRYVTCLREPVSRVTSHYHHASNDPTHYLYRSIHEQKLTLENYTASGLSGELSNGMTRMLAGVDDFHSTEVNQDTLKLAKHHLENHFTAILLSEHFDEGLLMLSQELGWKTPYYIRRKVGTHSASKDRLKVKTRQVIEADNMLDCELYQWARDRFQNEWAARPRLHPAVKKFRKSNQVAGKAIFCLREARRRVEKMMVSKH